MTVETMEGSGDSPGPSGLTVIESVELPCGHVLQPGWDQGDRMVTCSIDGQKALVRSRRRVIVSFEASSCPTGNK